MRDCWEKNYDVFEQIKAVEEVRGNWRTMGTNESVNSFQKMRGTVVQNNHTCSYSMESWWMICGHVVCRLNLLISTNAT